MSNQIAGHHEMTFMDKYVFSLDHKVIGLFKETQFDDANAFVGVNKRQNNDRCGFGSAERRSGSQIMFGDIVQDERLFTFDHLTGESCARNDRVRRVSYGVLASEFEIPVVILHVNCAQLRAAISGNGVDQIG